MRSILLYIEQGYIQSRLHPEHVYPPTRHVHRSPASSQQLPGLTTAKRTAPTLPPPTTPDTPDPSTTLPTHLQSVICNHAFRSSNLETCVQALHCASPVHYSSVPNLRVHTSPKRVCQLHEHTVSQNTQTNPVPRKSSVHGRL